jgi:tRNA nucleotidyltransferase (CCA-adding enzyme)
LFPELGELVGVEQREDYHPEGDVFEHTMQSIDASAKLELDEPKKFMIMLAVLCHDFGKPKTTDENKHTRGHEKVGVPIAKTFLRRFTWDSMLIRSVCKLVQYHMMPLLLVEQKSSIKAYKRLALKLAPEVSLKDLYLLAWADTCGRNKDGSEPLEESFEKEILEKFWGKSQEAKVETGPEEPVLHGRDLMGLIEPGPQMGLLLKKAYQIQIDQGVTDKEELKRLILDKD